MNPKIRSGIAGRVGHGGSYTGLRSTPAPVPTPAPISRPFGSFGYEGAGTAFDEAIASMKAYGEAVAKTGSPLPSLSATRTSATTVPSMSPVLSRTDSIKSTIKAVYERFPKHLALRLSRIRFGMADEFGKRVPRTVYDYSLCGASETDLQELIFTSGYRRSEFSIHEAYVNAVESMTRTWTQAREDAMLHWMELGGTEAAPGVAGDEQHDLDAAAKAAEAAARAEKTRITEEIYQANKKAILMEKLLRENELAQAAVVKKLAKEAEAELELALEFEARAQNPNFGTW